MDSPSEGSKHDDCPLERLAITIALLGVDTHYACFLRSEPTGAHPMVAAPKVGKAFLPFWAALSHRGLPPRFKSG